MDYKAKFGDKHPTNGIFTMVNDACKQKPRPEFKNLMEMITSTHEGNEKLSVDFMKDKKKDRFTIHHSAKEVKYDMKTFIEKNIDEISASLEDLIVNQSGSELISLIF